MLYLILTILMNVGIFTSFRSYSIFKINTFHAIVVNYFVCVFTGIIFIGNINFIVELPNKDWSPIALILGILFLLTFYLMAKTTQQYGISVASIASKISLAIPVIFSLFIFEIRSKNFDYFNYTGIILALIAIFLSSFKKEETRLKGIDIRIFILPFLIFLFNGTIDTAINFTNYKFLREGDDALFPIVIFASAAFIGAVILTVKKETINKKSFAGGLILGIINYFSIYFVVKALTALENDGAMVYPLLNMGIILFSTIVSIILFKESLRAVNKIGLILSILAIFMISYQEIFNFLTRLSL